MIENENKICDFYHACDKGLNMTPMRYSLFKEVELVL